MTVDEAFTLVSRAIDFGRAAHGYLICGDVGECEELARKILRKLFPDAIAQVEHGSHPDVMRLEPEGKKRIITVGAMREKIVDPMAVTAFSGGWKVGLIVGADRMEAPSANAFLKSLEEPAAKTLFLMLTDAPDAILPTILSRSQRIDLPLSAGLLTGETMDEMRELFSAPLPVTVFAKARFAKALAAILAEVKAEAEGDDESAEGVDIALARKAFFKTLVGFARGWMLEGRLERFAAFRNIEAIEEAYRQCERSISEDAVLSMLADRMTFPQES